MSFLKFRLLYLLLISLSCHQLTTIFHRFSTGMKKKLFQWSRFVAHLQYILPSVVYTCTLPVCSLLSKAVFEPNLYAEKYQGSSWITLSFLDGSTCHPRYDIQGIKDNLSNWQVSNWEMQTNFVVSSCTKLCTKAVHENIYQGVCRDQFMKFIIP